VTVALNLFALWKQESRDRNRAMAMETAPVVRFREAWTGLIGHPGTIRLLAVIGLGTFGFGMADVLLEPYGGQALGFTVAQTTKLTALLAAGSLIGFGTASKVLGSGGDPNRLAGIGALIGIPGLLAIVVSSIAIGPSLFVAGTLVMGVGAGLFGHATLTATIRNAPPEQIGLSLGAWGGVQATCAGIGIALAGVVRDILVGTEGISGLQAHLPYMTVFIAEIVFLVLAIIVVVPLMVRRSSKRSGLVAAAPQP